MRNILMTVMLLIVVALLFTKIVADPSTGLRVQIENQGNTANSNIASLQP